MYFSFLLQYLLTATTMTSDKPNWLKEEERKLVASGSVSAKCSTQSSTWGSILALKSEKAPRNAAKFDFLIYFYSLFVPHRHSINLVPQGAIRSKIPHSHPPAAGAVGWESSQIDLMMAGRGQKDKTEHLANRKSDL